MPSSLLQLDAVHEPDLDPDREHVLDEVGALLSRLTQSEFGVGSVLDTAGRRAGVMATAVADLHGGRWPAMLLAGDVVAGLALDQTWQRQQIDRLAADLAPIVELPADEVRLAVFVAAVSDPRLLALPPGLAIETTLRLLMAFAPVTSATFWLRDETRGPRCVVRLGAAARRTRAAATAALRDPDRSPPDTTAVPVRRWQHVFGVLAIQPENRPGSQPGAYVQEAARMLGLALEREALLDRGAARERALVEASERRLARFGYDLHDGPLQDIGAARRELCLLRRALAEALPPGEAALSALAQLDRVEEIVQTGEAGLRQLALSAESPAVLARSFPALLERTMSSFTEATGIAADLRLAGELDSLTGSQRIALLHVIEEALTNVREHSHATAVRVCIARGRDRVEAEIVDDGRGFEVEQTLVRAARRGRLGLVGMSERTLLLGGAFDVHSRPGGPTTVSVTLPAWRPLGSPEPAPGEADDLDAVVLWT